MLYIQGVLEMAHNIDVTRIYVEYQTKNSNSDLVLDKCFFKLLLLLSKMTLMTILVTFCLY
jgi:hypothetical protein